MTDLLINPQTTDPELEQDEPVCSHVVKVPEGSNTTVQAYLMEARVNGTPVTAICGFVWVPSRNPQSHPLCPKCEELLGFEGEFAEDRRPIRGG